MITLADLMRGRGRRRAADRIPVLEAELKVTQTKLVLAENLTRSQFHRIAELEGADQAFRRSIKEINAQLNTATTAHDLLLDCYDELAARYTETDKALRDLRAITTPVPVPPRPAYDPDATAENVMPLWDATGLPSFAAASSGQAA